MAKILINGLSAKVGGGKSILTNYLEILHTSHTEHQYIILVPECDLYKKFNKIPSIEVISFPTVLTLQVTFPI